MTLLKGVESLVGSTYEIKPPGEKAIYVTINDKITDAGTENERRMPFEIFINSKNMEHFQWILGLTRLISRIFRKGYDVTFVTGELQDVFDPNGGYFKPGGKFMPSLVADIGNVIEHHFQKIGLIEETDSTQEESTEESDAK